MLLAQNKLEIATELPIAARAYCRIPEAWTIITQEVDTAHSSGSENISLPGYTGPVLSPKLFQAIYTEAGNEQFDLQLWSSTITVPWASPLAMSVLGDPPNSPLFEQLNSRLSALRIFSNTVTKNYAWKPLQLTMYKGIPAVTGSYRSLHLATGNVYDIRLLATALEDAQLTIIETWQRTGGKYALPEKTQQQFTGQIAAFWETLSLQPEPLKTIPLRQSQKNIGLPAPSRATNATGLENAVTASNKNHSNALSSVLSRENNGQNATAISGLPTTTANATQNSQIGPPKPQDLGTLIRIEEAATVILPPHWVLVANKLTAPIPGLPDIGEKIIALRLSKKGDIIAVLSAQSYRDKLTQEALQNLTAEATETLASKVETDIRKAVERMGTIETYQAIELVQKGGQAALFIAYQARFFGKSYQLQKFITSIKTKKFTLQIWKLLPAEEQIAAECAALEASILFIQ